MKRGAGLAVGLFLLALVSCGYWLCLSGIPQTPAQDLAKHVALVLNFADAIRDGQLVPRLQLPPAEYPDLPVFQYYGFMDGALAAPWILLGMSGLHAIALSLVLLRWAGLAALFRSARLLGTDRPVAFLTASLYALGPYAISNVFGRSAVPEAHAHSLLPFITLGWITICGQKKSIGVPILALAIFNLALTTIFSSCMAAYWQYYCSCFQAESRRSYAGGTRSPRVSYWRRHNGFPLS